MYTLDPAKRPEAFRPGASGNMEADSAMTDEPCLQMSLGQPTSRGPCNLIRKTNIDKPVVQLFNLLLLAGYSDVRYLVDSVVLLRLLRVFSLAPRLQVGCCHLESDDNSENTGQIVTTSSDLTPNGGLHKNGPIFAEFEVLSLV